MLEHTTTDYTFEEVLIYFSKSILNKKDEDSLLWDLVKNCIAKLGFVDCVVYLLDDEKEFLIQKAAFGTKNPESYKIVNPMKIPIGEGITGYVAQNGKSEIVKDTSKDRRYLVDDENRLSEIAVPIATDSVVYGVIDCEHPEKDFFTHQHLRILSAIASLCSIKLENIRADRLLKDEQENLLRIKQEAIALKLKAFRSQMNPHFVFNALNAIQYFITTGNKKSALDYFSIFSKLIRFYLKHLEKDTVFLKDEVAMLQGYLKLQKLRYNHRFDYQIHFNEKAAQSGARIPAFVLQTLFENIIEHAIYHQPKNHLIKAFFEVNDCNVRVDIAYNYGSTIKKNAMYLPEYRERIVQWQHQIRLLNKAKNYGITKKVTFGKHPDKNDGTISLNLPNLF
ncbi:histidine kinase [Spongiimicrobium sp. 3-5]|uniref:histidine kinase n=1 Tax=Spongiimicrobium sp. 3-5 TaxID=3332596 RepID=UPI00397FDC34